jgi:hypothetical protein
MESGCNRLAPRRLDRSIHNAILSARRSRPIARLWPWSARRFAFKERLVALLGRPVDLVMASPKRKPRFLASVNQARQLLSAA